MQDEWKDRDEGQGHAGAISMMCSGQQLCKVEGRRCGTDEKQLKVMMGSTRLG